ncbi:MAG: NAD(P)/FAD-dependent oxidoreductase [Oscillospiraceae bacterium]|nr:NAD(P)/FAD-dependent oxidoreductase [Oscillospiraceae bacterium]
MKIGIIGGGASGLMAAIAAKNENTDVTIYEREKRVGKKILATGNGRCNMTNTTASPDNYHGFDISFIDGAIKRFWVDRTLDFFTECGILWKEEDGGKVYPYSDTASSVLDVLRRRLDTEGISVECGFDVKSVKKKGREFIIEDYRGRKEVCDRVVIAGGGKASPALGSNGSCYEILKSFGHTITAIYPSLVQIKTETDIVKKLKGIKVNAALTLGGRCETGEILFTDYGLSGPPVFFLSAYMAGCKTAELDLMPEYKYTDVHSILSDRCAYLCNVPLEDYFTGMLNKRVGQALLKSVGIAPLSRLSGSLSGTEIKQLAAAIKKWSFKIEGTMSWNNAQVTKGGAVTAQFDKVTMESKLINGLYACGEVLDIDGDCGGYNLQWAWSSGYLAGTAAAK